jgi:hypothetical protein
MNTNSPSANSPPFDISTGTCFTQPGISAARTRLIAQSAKRARVDNREPKANGLATALIRFCTFGILLTGCCISGCSCGPIPSGTHARTADYATLVTAFTIGSIALESGDKKGRDTEYLTKLTKLAPDEAAGWADLGLIELRNNKLTEAAADLGKAHNLAPTNAGIEKILSLLADRQGDLKAAITHGQAAVKLAPDDLRARYALAQELERQNTPDGDAAFQHEIEEILSRQPSNLIAELELLMVASKRGDGPAFQRAVAALDTQSKSFDAKSKEYFLKVKSAAAGTDVETASLDSRFLKNTLQANVSYSVSYMILSRDPKYGVGDPITQFIKLPAIPSNPDAADTGTKFSPTVVSGSGKWIGAVWFNGDGKQELIIADEKGVKLPDGDTLPYPGGGIPTSRSGVLALDVNYDLKSDLLFAGAGGMKLYIQGANGKFTDVTAKMKLPVTITSAPYTGAWTMDIEADGDLDIVLGSAHGEPTVLQNNGDGTWKAIRPFKGIDGVREFVAADIDADGNPDVAMIDAAGKLHVYMNLRGGEFKERPVPGSIGKLSALAAADLRGESRLSYLLMDSAGVILELSDKAKGTDWNVSEVARWSPPPKDTAGSCNLFVADLDNNGGLDIVASTNTEAQVWMCGADYSLSPLATPISGGVCGFAKPDSGGRYDLIGISTDGQPQRFVNSGTKSYNWQEVRPHPWPSEFQKGKGDRRVNSFGIGGEIEMRAGLLYEKLSMDSPSIHFGLGSHASVDAVRVLWPNGDIRAEFADTLKPDQSVGLPHRLEESCPFLFTWNGQAMEFVTDCIWRSPLGLKINAQDTAGVAMTEDWVKIRGNQLVPDNAGKYDLRITAELNETHFFDHLSLLTVDHPVGTDIFVDERFAVPPPPLKVNITTPLQPIKRAVDDNGADVTETIRARDGVYLDTFGRGDYQGVTRDHWVEIELNDNPPGAGKQWLVCSGFIYPTNSSINVAIGQGHNEPPRGLSIETPDSRGRWSVARAGLGFPEGKVKTILLDLTGVFKPGAPRKLRLRTNLEIYWDAIQTAYSVPENTTKITHQYASSADLEYRGFSEIKAANNSSPGLPVSYDSLLSVGTQWRDLEGYYTRYGDVKELLAKVDDRYVIMNAGDELRLKFDAPTAPPAGFTRDYVLIGDGWVKDGDYNTTFSKTVLPLPEHGTSSYSVRPGILEDDPVYRKHAKDWETYHTRYVAPDGFGSRLVPGR